VSSVVSWKHWTLLVQRCCRAVAAAVSCLCVCARRASSYPIHLGSSSPPRSITLFAAFWGRRVTYVVSEAQNKALLFSRAHGVQDTSHLAFFLRSLWNLVPFHISSNILLILQIYLLRLIPDPTVCSGNPSRHDDQSSYLNADNNILNTSVFECFSITWGIFIFAMAQPLCSNKQASTFFLAVLSSFCPLRNHHPLKTNSGP
jgi:hypothetical protein